MPSSSSAQQLQAALGRRLREIREDAGMSQRDLSARVGWHSSKVSKIEHARQAPTVVDIRNWCTACGVAHLAEDLTSRQRAVHEMFTQWRRMEAAGLAEAQKVVNGLWRDTGRFHAYEGWMIPGPFQTRGYIEARLRAVKTNHEVPGGDDDIEAAIEIRARRGAVLNDARKRFAVVLEESALRHCLTDTDTMIGQLGHLLTIATLPNVSLGIIPLGVERRRAAVEGFWMYDERRVDVELVSGWLSITAPAELALYRRAFADLASLAVHGTGARRLIMTAMHALET